jgi:hypothetical protein
MPPPVNALSGDELDDPIANFIPPKERALDATYKATRIPICDDFISNNRTKHIIHCKL